MPFSPEKRAFFVEALGEERVLRMEKELESKGKELVAYGVRFKQLLDDVVSFGDAEVVRLFDVFMGISSNIIHAHELAVPQKLAKLKQAVTDLATRINMPLHKTKTGPVNPAAKYIDDLKSRGHTESKAAKELRKTGQPGSEFVADVLDGRVVQG